MKTLFAWIGLTDLKAPKLNSEKEVGPIAGALRDLEFDRALLLAQEELTVDKDFIAWLRARTKTPIDVDFVKLTGPTKLGEIYESVVSRIDRYKSNHRDLSKMIFHLSPGTPA